MSFLLSRVLLDPGQAPDLHSRRYGQLLRQARSANLLAALAERIRDEGLMEQIPDRVRRHLESVALVHTKQKHDLAYHLKLVQRALAPTGQKMILLKGAAYLQAGIAAGRGRLISDIDLIVPEADIGAAEQALNLQGWKSGKLDPYNERYYRQWMHEIPPLGHSKYGSTLDLHFTILPPTAAANIDARLLFEQIVEVQPGVYTLSRPDMVIHSATHLFHEGEFHNGLRDLWDLDRMLREFSAGDSGFWDHLLGRARALDLVGPLLYGLTYSQRIFDTPVPAGMIEEANSRARKLRKPLMDFLFRRAFRPDQPECRLPFTDSALYLLYLRSHYLRMPLYLLIPHLARKAWMSKFEESDNAGIAAAKPAG